MRLVLTVHWVWSVLVVQLLSEVWYVLAVQQLDIIGIDRSGDSLVLAVQWLGGCGQYWPLSCWV